MKLKELLLLTDKQKTKGFFIRGNIQCGEFKDYWKNGNLWEYSFYLKGKLNGEYKEYYSNGKLYKHCFYLKGLYHSESKYYLANGNLIEHKLFENGILIKDYLK